MSARVPLIKVFLGSFFIQSSWSFEKMQALGFAAAIEPAIRAAYRDDEKGRNEALKRQLAYYNAHPYMASPVLGASIRLEVEAAGGRGQADAAAVFKKKIMGPYGAIGDAFFWASLRPLASCLGILATVLWGGWGPLVFLAFYNAPHLWMRWNGLKKGYEMGEGVAGYVKEMELPAWGARAKEAACLLLGVFSAVVVFRAASLSAPGAPRAAFESVAALLALGAFTVALRVLVRKGLTVTRLVYVIMVPLIVYGVISC